MDIKELRAEYRKRYRKNPGPLWGEEELKQKLAVIVAPDQDDTANTEPPKIIVKPIGQTGYNVGDVVQVISNGERFSVDEIDRYGRLGRKVNNRDPLKYYNPSEVKPYEV